jgi:hypothetical protein
MGASSKQPPAESWAFRPLGNELAEALRAELAGWPGVTARGMMGTLSFFRGKQMLGAYVSRDLLKKPVKPDWVNRPGEPPFVWVRLRLDDKLRALRRPGVRAEGAQRLPEGEKVQASRLGFAGWIEIPLDSRAALEEAVRWFGCAYERPPRRALAPRKSRQRARKSRPADARA